VRLVRPSQLLFDAGLAAAVFAFTVALLAHGGIDGSDRELHLWGGVLAAFASLPLAGRRVAPPAVLALVTAATAALYGFRYGLGPPIGFAIALYSAAEYRDEARPRTWAAVLAGSLVVLVGPHLVRDGLAPELLLGAAVWLAAWFAGDRTRLRRERLAEVVERARRAEQDAERERRLAAAEERTRIARDLHDSAGHAINVILVQAGAARLLQEQLERVLRVYVDHYNSHRPHRALGRAAPVPGPRLRLVAPDPPEQLRGRDRLGGLIHEYARAA
jgi:signal transduction histidine kinase